MQASRPGDDVGIFGGDGGSGNSLHVDYERSNVAVGPVLVSFSGDKNVFLGVRSGEDAKTSTENVVTGWNAGGGMGRSNVVAGSRAVQFSGPDTSYSVIMGALAGYTALSISNTILVGSRAAEGLTNAVDSLVAGVNTKALNDLIQCAVVGVDCTVGGLVGQVSERVTAFVNASWIGGKDVVALGNGILTQDRSSGVVAVGNNINAGAGDNLVVGMDLMVDVESTGVEIFGKGTRVVGPQSNVLAVGAGSIEIARGDAEYIGSGIFYDRVIQELSLMNGVLTAREDHLDLGGVFKVFRGQGVVMTGVEFEGEFAISRGEGRWRMSINNVSSDQHDLVFTSSKGTRVVFHDHFEPGVTNFTGQHRCVLKPGSIVPRPGFVLVSTGEFCDLRGKGVSVDEAIPVVEVACRACDPCVFGVVSSVEDEHSTVRRLEVGHIGFDVPKVVGEVRAVVNGSGEGGIWVCDEGGPCCNGDLLCSSSRPGYAMRQADGVVTNYTCAKLTSGCIFGLDGTCFAGCVYKF
jgi:hypothetical protein